VFLSADGAADLMGSLGEEPPSFKEVELPKWDAMWYQSGQSDCMWSTVLKVGPWHPPLNGRP
jgi:hypothetical protein